MYKRQRVDLPEPLRPIIAANSPFRTDISIFSSDKMLLSALIYECVRLAALTAYSKIYDLSLI